MEAYPKGKESLQHSVHDDLDYFVEKLQYERSKYKPKGKLRYYESIRSYFLPKSTAKEKQLVETKNTEFMDTLMEKNPNKILQNMKKSESKTMYVKGVCLRQTFQMDAFATHQYLSTPRGPAWTRKSVLSLLSEKVNQNREHNISFDDFLGLFRDPRE